MVVGCSAGCITAMMTIFQGFSQHFPVPILMVQHRSVDDNGFLRAFLDEHCPLRVVEAEAGEVPVVGQVYLAPADYHLLVEEDGSMALSIDPPHNYSRPSIDVLFETAANCYGERVLGLLLTGASADGALGLKRIRDMGGTTIVQDPTTAEASLMPRSAIGMGAADFVVPLEGIAMKTLELLMAK